MRGRRVSAVIGVAWLTAWCAGCGGSPTAPSSNSASSLTAYAGSWTGVAKARDCRSAVPTLCGSLFSLAAFQLTLSGSGAALAGRLKVGTYRADITASLTSDGSLRLAGDGIGIGQTITLQQWTTRREGAALIGTFTVAFTSSAGSGTLSASLEHVYLSGTPEANESLPAELRFTLKVLEGSADRYRPRAGFPGMTHYSACFSIENAAPQRATLTMVTTPIGADGANYDVDQIHLTGQGFSVDAANVLVGCGGGAQDDNYLRAIAPQHRLHVDFAYEDGTTASAEGTAPVHVSWDDL